MPHYPKVCGRYKRLPRGKRRENVAAVSGRGRARIGRNHINGRMVFCSRKNSHHKALHLRNFVAHLRRNS